MCDCLKDGCQHPEELTSKPEDCTPEQIEKCHGKDAQHGAKASSDQK